MRDHLDLFNVGVTGVSTYYPVHFFLKNDRGETLGGLLGSVWGGWLHITYLWVDEVGARQGLGDPPDGPGRGLCARARLPFGRRSTPTPSRRGRSTRARGYEVFGTLDDYPKGHKKFFLRKKL